MNRVKAAAVDASCSGKSSLSWLSESSGTLLIIIIRIDSQTGRFGHGGFHSARLDCRIQSARSKRKNLVPHKSRQLELDRCQVPCPSPFEALPLDWFVSSYRSLILHTAVWHLFRHAVFEAVCRLQCLYPYPAVHNCHSRRYPPPSVSRALGCHQDERSIVRSDVR